MEQGILINHFLLKYFILNIFPETDYFFDKIFLNPTIDLPTIVSLTSDLYTVNFTFFAFFGEL